MFRHLGSDCIWFEFDLLQFFLSFSFCIFVLLNNNQSQAMFFPQQKMLLNKLTFAGKVSIYRKVQLQQIHYIQTKTQD